MPNFCSALLAKFIKVSIVVLRSALLSVNRLGYGEYSSLTFGSFFLIQLCREKKGGVKALPEDITSSSIIQI